MAARRAFLSAALALLAAAGAAGARARPANSCSGCHGVHHETRGTCTGCHRGDDAVTRVTLAHAGLLRGGAAAWSLPGSAALAEGEWLRERLGCRRCHVTGGAGNTLAISLDPIAWTRGQEALRRSLREPATFMPDFALSERQADALVAVLLRDGRRHAREARYQVHFTGAADAPGDAFARRCGGCHRALTPAGPAGTGTDGPNLSGLLSPWYPDSAGRRWDRERLAAWLRNPRSERPGSTMRPVETTPEEFEQVVRALSPAGR